MGGKRNILVTGGAGYFGSVLVEKLLEDNENTVHVLDGLFYGASGTIPFRGRRNYRFWQGDITDPVILDYVFRQKIDSVVHLAALVGEPLCMRKRELAEKVNYHGTRALVDLARRNGVSQFIFASTCSNYGSRSEVVDEDSELEPISLYSKTKVLAEKYIFEHAQNPTVLRFATLFGPSHRMRLDIILNEWVYEATSKGTVEIYSPNAWRPLVHVRDASAAVIACIESPDLVAGEAFNVGADDLNLRKIEIAETIKRCMTKNIPVMKVSGMADSDARSYRVSFAKIGRTIPFQIRTSIEEGVKELLRYLPSLPDSESKRYRNADGFGEVK